MSNNLMENNNCLEIARNLNSTDGLHASSVPYGGLDKTLNAISSASACRPNLLDLNRLHASSVYEGPDLNKDS